MPSVTPAPRTDDEGRPDQRDPDPRSRRFPRRVYARGSEPDPRFTLANERTYLAWIRTSLALLASGVALLALDLPVHQAAETVASYLLVVLGCLAPVQAWVGWMRTERAMRERRPLPPPLMAAPMSAGAVVAGLVLLVGLVVR